MNIAKKGIRIDELINYYNEYLSTETYYYSFFNKKDTKDISMNVKTFWNKDVPGIKIFVLKNNQKPIDQVDKEIEYFYGVDIKKMYELLKDKTFYFIVIIKYVYKYSDQLYVPNEIFTDINDALNRAKAYCYTPNLLKIKKYIEDK